MSLPFAVKQFNLRALQFNANCSEHVVLIPFSASYDNDKIVYVDAFPAERYISFSSHYGAILIILVLIPSLSVW